MSSSRISRGLSGTAKNSVSMVQYKKLTGKSDEELQRIFEKEMRLGVLSTQNLLYPFPGMQRPVVPEDSEVHREEAQEQVSEVLDKFSIEDQIESTRIQAQILALDSLRRAAENADNLNFTWEDDNAILNTQTFWESYLIIEPLKELGAKCSMVPCPQIFNKEVPLTKVEGNEINDDRLLSVVCPSSGGRTKERLELVMRNIRDVLRIRGFWVRDFDDPSISEDLSNHIRDGKFSVECINGCTVLREMRKPVTSALLITNAQNYDELPLLILQEYTKVQQTMEGLTAFFYKTGIDKRFLGADGDVLDRQLYEIYFKNVFFSYAKSWIVAPCGGFFVVKYSTLPIDPTTRAKSYTNSFYGSTVSLLGLQTYAHQTLSGNLIAACRNGELKDQLDSSVTRSLIEFEMSGDCETKTRFLAEHSPEHSFIRNLSKETLKKASSLERIKLGYKVYFSSRSELQREYNLLYDQFGLREFGLITTASMIAATGVCFYRARKLRTSIFGNRRSLTIGQKIKTLDKTEQQGSYRRLVLTNTLVLAGTLVACETYGNYVFGSNLVHALTEGEIRMLSSKKAQDLVFHAAGGTDEQDLDHNPSICRMKSHANVVCEGATDAPSAASEKLAETHGMPGMTLLSIPMIRHGLSRTGSSVVKNFVQGICFSIPVALGGNVVYSRMETMKAIRNQSFTKSFPDGFIKRAVLVELSSLPSEEKLRLIAEISS
ncbi:Oidioi.mRNA.OKI2018_I69.XSR.g16123.t1.cds [Oikopleura dioica]|uniref:Oidioi.mRNA.OKI2018_I69.XSR.g16123.t1.cds n=1 Tax=Oikopleura dioica TaxID=34765 RepID=A0ABN7SPE5_OIKDI|nr:Oidioi.mRNA.OKI2018_I69.XSR.g16123.t1.cds [Oikopleura dioica]